LDNIVEEENEEDDINVLRKRQEPRYRPSRKKVMPALNEESNFSDEMED